MSIKALTKSIVSTRSDFRHKSSVISPYNTWTERELLDYYRSESTARYFPVVEAQETEQRKIDGVLENRFDFNNEIHQLPDSFDWLKNPSTDREWQILLHKFYYAAGLGVAYHESRDSLYLEKWIRLTTSWMDQVQPDFIAGVSPLNSERWFAGVTGRRIQNWIYAHYYFVTKNPTDNVAPDFYARFLDSIHRQVSYLCIHLAPNRNHRTLELYAIFLAAVVFPEMVGARDWLRTSLRNIVDNMRSDLLADGVQCELSTDYHHLVLRNYLCVRRLAALNDITVPVEMDTMMLRALEFSKYVHKPDGSIPSLSDGDCGSFPDLLEHGSRLYSCPELRYVASRGKEGKPPTSRSMAFPHGGYYILRSGWGEVEENYEDERYLIFDCGPLGEGNHGHFDLLNIEMAAYGQSLIVDPGRYTYDESGETNWRVLFRGTSYHNTVVVDGRNQTCYKPGKHKYKIRGPQPDWELAAFESKPGFDYLHGIARSHEYAVTHERKIFFQFPDYWIVSDLLLASEEHDYELLYHLSPRADANTVAEVRRRTFLIESPNLVLAQPFDTKVQMRLDQGFISPRYGIKHTAPIVNFARQAANACFHTIIFPYRHEKPEITVDLLPVMNGSEIASNSQVSGLRIDIETKTKRFTDYYLTRHQDSDCLFSFAGFTTRDAMYFVRTDSDGEIVSQFST